MSADIGSTSLLPDEAAFHAAWLGKLWPRYRRLYEGGAGRRPFEWRAALYPLWLGIPGLYVPLAVVVAAVVAACSAVAMDVHMTELEVIALLSLGLLALWPLVGAWALVAAPTDGLTILLPLGMVAISVALGVLTPRWIMAEGRRRWRRHQAQVAAGTMPPVPRAVTALSPLRLVVLLAVVAIPTWLLLFPPHDHPEGKPAIAAMKSDLRNLVTAEESYFADYVTYTTSLGTSYTPSASVTVTILGADSSGWSATASHAATPRTCGIFVGDAASPIEGASEGEPRCEGMVPARQTGPGDSTAARGRRP